MSTNLVRDAAASQSFPPTDRWLHLVGSAVQQRLRRPRLSAAASVSSCPAPWRATLVVWSAWAFQGSGAPNCCVPRPTSPPTSQRPPNPWAITALFMQPKSVDALSSAYRIRLRPPADIPGRRGVEGRHRGHWERGRASMTVGGWMGQILTDISRPPWDWMPRASPSQTRAWHRLGTLATFREPRRSPKGCLQDSPPTGQSEDDARTQPVRTAVPPPRHCRRNFHRPRRPGVSPMPVATAAASSSSGLFALSVPVGASTDTSARRHGPSRRASLRNSAGL